MWKDWCPLCGRRFQADSPEDLVQQNLDHAEEKNGEMSECEKNFQPLETALADDHY